MKNKILEMINDESTNLSLLRLSAREQPGDRFLSSLVHRLEHGHQTLTLLSVVEIVSRWNPARVTGAALPQTFARSFSRSQHHSILTKFEDALKNVNALLITDSAKIQSPVNCVLALVAENEVYFSTIGNAKVLLLRKNKLSTIETNKELSVEDKTFVTVTSGELMADDWFFVSTNELAGVLHRQASEELNLPIEGLEEKLRQLIELENSAAITGIAVRYTPDQAVERTIYLDEIESRLPIALPSFSAPRISLGDVSGGFGRATETLRSIGSTIWNQLRRIPWRQGYNRLESFVPRWRFRRLVIPAVLAVILLLIIISVRGQLNAASNPNNSQISNLLTQVQALTPTESRNFLNTSLSQNQYNDLSADEQNQLGVLTRQQGLEITPLPPLVSELAAPVVTIDNLPGTADLFLLDQTGQLWRFQDQTIVKIEQKGLVGQPLSLAVLAENKIVVSDQIGNLWFFDGSAEQPIALSLPTALATGGKLLQKFESNLYLYSLTDKSVYRVANYTKEVTDATLYTQPATLTLGTVNDWIITGDIIGVGETGIIQSFRRNALTKINQPSVETSGSFRLAALADGFVVINNRILTRYNATGQKQTEQILVSNDPITDTVFVNGALYLVAGNKLYSL